MESWTCRCSTSPTIRRLRQYAQGAHPRLESRRSTAPTRWSSITAEYNHSYTAALKNAIDFLHNEWHHKPLGFVSYGGVAAGTRAMQALKPVAIALALVPIVAAVNIPFVQQSLTDDGTIVGNDVMVDAASAMLDELMTMHGVSGAAARGAGLRAASFALGSAGLTAALSKASSVP